jgi:hypothetical protein
VLARAGAQGLDVWCFARASRDDLDPGREPETDPSSHEPISPVAHFRS